MKRKVFKINVFDDCNYFVIAYSWEHALVELMRGEEEGFIAFQVDGFKKKDVVVLSKEEMDEQIVDYIYPTDEKRTINILDLFEELNKSFYGVIADDFIAY